VTPLPGRKGVVVLIYLYCIIILQHERMMESPCRRFRVAAATAFVCSCSASVGALPVFLWGSGGVLAMRDWVGMLVFPPGALCASW